MKIIHMVLGKARFKRSNGVNKVAHNLAHHQRNLGHEVSLWGITPSPKAIIAERNYKTAFFQAQKNRFSISEELKNRIAKLRYEPALVHLHGGFVPEFYQVATCLRKHKVPYVYSPHGSYSPGALKDSYLRKKVYFTIFESRIVKHAHAVHFLGKIQYENFDRIKKINHKILIPNGQDMEELQYQPEYMDRPPVPVFSYCGRLINHYKGLDILFNGFSKFKSQGGDGMIWLIGDGKDEEALRSQAGKLKIEEDVVFWGSKYGNEKLNILANSDAFVHPSRSEGFPTGVLEAAGLGLPCIISTATNVGDYIHEHAAGIHLENNDPKHISRAMHEVEGWWREGSLRQVGSRARNMVETVFNWENIAQNMVMNYVSA